MSDKQTWMTELEYLYRAVHALEEIYLTADIAGLDGQWAMEQAIEIRLEIARILRGETPHRTILRPAEAVPCSGH